jgi:hypothetical protein
METMTATNTSPEIVPAIWLDMVRLARSVPSSPIRDLHIEAAFLRFALDRATRSIADDLLINAMMFACTDDDSVIEQPDANPDWPHVVTAEMYAAARRLLFQTRIRSH